MRYLRTFLPTLILAMLSAFLALPLQGCAAAAALLPDVPAILLDGMQILNVIQSFMSTYFAANPNAATQAQFNTLFAQAQTALNTLTRAAQGATALTDANVAQAFTDFEQAYLSLMAFLKPFGVDSVAGVPATFAASPAPGKLLVPQPLAFKPRSVK